MNNLKSRSLYLIKVLIFAFLWLSFSYILILLNDKWHILSKKACIALTILSPLGLLTALFLFVFIMSKVEYLYKRYYLTSPWAIERISSVRLPDYQVVSFEQTDFKRHFLNYDYIQVEFEELFDDKIYHKLDSLVKEGVWEKHGDKYLFEKPLDVFFEKINFKDYTFSIQLVEGEKRGYFFINYESRI